jgi:hypothetical protein
MSRGKILEKEKTTRSRPKQKGGSHRKSFMTSTTLMVEVAGRSVGALISLFI